MPCSDLFAIRIAALAVEFCILLTRSLNWSDFDGEFIDLAIGSEFWLLWCDEDDEDDDANEVALNDTGSDGIGMGRVGLLATFECIFFGNVADLLFWDWMEFLLNCCTLSVDWIVKTLGGLSYFWWKIQKMI